MYAYDDGVIKYSKAQVYQGIRDYVYANTGVYVQKEEKIEEMPNLLRHACAGTGVTGLMPCFFQIPDTNMTVQFYFCTMCGKLYLPKEF